MKKLILLLMFLLILPTVLATQTINIIKIEQKERDGTLIIPLREYLYTGEQLWVEVEIRDDYGWYNIKNVDLIAIPENFGAGCSSGSIINGFTKEYRCIFTVPYSKTGRYLMRIISYARKQGEGAELDLDYYYFNPEKQIELSEPINFLGDFMPGNTLYTNWIKVGLDAPDDVSADINLYGKDAYPDRNNLPIECNEYTKKERVCERIPYERTSCRRKRVCTRVPYNYTNRRGRTYIRYRRECEYIIRCRTWITYKRECHYEYSTIEKCRKVGKFMCPTTNNLDLSNFRYTLNGIDWYNIPYKPNIITINTLTPSQSFWIKFKVDIPVPCFGEYKIDDSIFLYVE